MLLIILVIVVLILYIYLPCGVNANMDEQFTPTKPMAEDVMKNINLFGTSLDAAKNKMPWMNVVSYEGVRQLMRQGGNPTIDTIMGVL